MSTDTTNANSTKYCTSCGHQLQSTAKFCSECGVNQFVTPEEGGENEVLSSSNTKSGNSRSKSVNSSIAMNPTNNGNAKKEQVIVNVLPAGVHECHFCTGNTANLCERRRKWLCQNHQHIVEGSCNTHDIICDECYQKQCMWTVTGSIILIVIFIVLFAIYN
eukprot:585745_1